MRSLVCAGGVYLLSACGTETIKVADGALVDQVDYQWLSSDRKNVRAVFYPDDEKVTLSVHFDYNIRAAYEWYRVEWIEPNGKPYKVVSTRTEFGSHRDLQASIKIRGMMAAQRPGLWRVRLYHLDEKGQQDGLLYARLFRIAEAVDANNPTVPAPTPSEIIQEPATITRLSTPLPAETGVVEATLTVISADHQSVTQKPLALLPPRFPGCPPLYYPPGEGCIEEAPEE